MILLFDTSGKDLHCGLYDPALRTMKQEFHYIASASERGVHDTMLAVTVDTLLHKEGITARDISRIGFINGPGSFTGLRIGLAFAKGIAYGAHCELVPILAHQWLAACVALQLPEQHFSALITPGYEPGSVYYAAVGAEEKITLHKKEELQSVKTIAAFEPIANLPIELALVTIDLAVLGELTLSHEGQGYTLLDPFYGTDFKPHPGSKKAG